MIKVKAWFTENVYEDEVCNKEVLADLIDYFAKCEKSFIKCEITYEDGTIEKLINSDYSA